MLLGNMMTVIDAQCEADSVQQLCSLQGRGESTAAAALLVDVLASQNNRQEKEACLFNSSLAGDQHLPLLGFKASCHQSTVHVLQLHHDYNVIMLQR
jgi:electron transfer flavoprotein alpha subunit